MKTRYCVATIVLWGLIIGAPWGVTRGGSPLQPFFALANGDANGDWHLDLTDPVYLLNHLYTGGPAPVPVACGMESPAVRNGDANGDWNLDLSDAVYLLSHLFTGGPPPMTCEGPGGGAANSNPRVIPANARPYGLTWGEWTARWWQWTMSLPVTAHPLFDTADCDAGQSGPVWFLGGVFTGVAATRDCEVPAGKSILLPVLNVDCSTAEPPPFHGDDEASLRACAAAFQDTGGSLSATIDGREVKNLTNAPPYRVQSPVFDFCVPADNVLFIPGPVCGQAVSDGVWLFLAPLSAGSHTIHFEGMFPGFPINMTYNLTVK